MAKLPAAVAQITPDASLPQNTEIIRNGDRVRIEGGTRAGGNLFHSFTEFSVPAGIEAFFNNSTEIENIFSRITGNQISNIDGLIRANGSANLFLLNPNGIVFGETAQLDIGGSFMATTGDRIKFADGTTFAATATETAPLLTISVPIGVQFGQNPGEIQISGPGNNLKFDSETLATVRSDRPVGLQVRSGQTLALLGGNINAIGGNLTAESGRIELGSVAGGEVTLSAIATGWALGYDSVENFQDIRFTHAASASTSGNGGGTIQVQSRRLELRNASAILADTLGDADGGGLTVRASEAIEMTSLPDIFSSSLFATVDPGATGNGGNLTVETGRLLMKDGAIVAADTFGAGNAGNLTIRANSVELLAQSLVATSVYADATGDGGDLTIESRQLQVRDGAQVLAFTQGAGDAGALRVRAEEVQLQGASASGRFASVLSASTEANATGNGGKLTVETSLLRVIEGARLGVGASGAGNAGSLSVTAQAIEVGGTTSRGSISIISADTFDKGDGGHLSIDTERLILRDGGQIAAGTFGRGQGGNVAVRASDRMELRGSAPAVELSDRPFFQDASGQRFPSGIFASSTDTGNAGTLAIAAGELQVMDGAQISVSSTQGSQAGNLEVVARQIRLNAGTLSADTTRGDTGNITLNTGDLQLQDRSQITTNAGGEATGGNIRIQTDILMALDNSDITANSVANFGGRVEIEVRGIFGSEFRSQTTPESDITATGGTPALSGTVKIANPDIDPAGGLVQLPIEVRDAIDAIASRCEADNSSQFIITGRGGLPEDPIQPFIGTSIWHDLRPIDTGEEGLSDESASANANSSLRSLVSKPQSTSDSAPAIEATGWVRNAWGQVELVANSSFFVSGGDWERSQFCQRSHRRR